MYGLVSMLGLGVFSGCDVVYKYVNREGAEEKELVGEIMPFESNDIIKDVQILLKLYGYNPGGVDGVIGTRTRQSIESFQKSSGIATTGFVDQETWEKVSLPKYYQLVEGDKVNIEFVQEILYELGLYLGKIDGKEGPKTKEAIKDFQKERGIKAEGQIDYKTLEAMTQYLIYE